MLDLWLIRHGESLGNVDGSQADTPLSPRGVEQATALVSALGSQSFERVLCSPLERARQTASCAMPERPATIEPALRELRRPPDRFIDVSALSFAELEALATATEAEPAETGLEFRGRIRRWLDSLANADSVIAFTHYAVIREAVHLLVPNEGWPKIVGQASIFRVQVEGGHGRLIWRDRREHLEG